MKFAWVGDVHIGPYKLDYGIHRKGTIYAEKLLKDFVHKMNTSFHPDFVVQGGDLIEDENRTVDIQNYKKGLAMVSKLTCPVYHLVGNHELRKLKNADLLHLLGYKKLYFSFDRDNFRFIFLFTKHLHTKKEVVVDQKQLAWLKKEVNTNKKILLFSHHSLVPINTKGNFWFSKHPEVTFIKNSQQFFTIIGGKNVKLAFNGHLHWNKKKIVNSIPFITIQSLVENDSMRVEGPPANAHALVILGKNTVYIKIEGREKAKYRVRM